MLQKTSFRAICLCISLLFSSISGWSQDCSDPNVGILIDLGEDYSIQLGDTSNSIEILFSNPNGIETIEWTPSDITCISGSTGENCYEIAIKPFVNTCYSVIVTNANGCSATDEICISVETCDDIIANSLIDITPETPSNAIDLKLDIARTQLFNIEILQNSDIILETRKLVRKGPNTVSVDISSLESGEYQINLDLFPDPITSSFTKQ